MARRLLRKLGGVRGRETGFHAEGRIGAPDFVRSNISESLELGILGSHDDDARVALQRAKSPLDLGAGNAGGLPFTSVANRRQAAIGAQYYGRKRGRYETYLGIQRQRR